MPPASQPQVPAQDEPSLHTQEELDRLALGLVDAEAARVAVRLHDTVCQSLSAVQFLAGLAARQLSREAAPAAGQLREIVQQLDTATSELQDLMAELRPAGVDKVGRLPGALHEIAQRFARGSACEFRCPASLPIPDLPTANELCRILFSSLALARLRGASRIEAAFTASADELVLDVSCDAAQLHPKSAPEDALRCDTLDRRVRLLGGTTRCAQTAGRFTFEARIPAK